MTTPLLDEGAYRPRKKFAGRVAALRRENRLLRVAAALHRTLVRATNETELLSEICRKTTKEAGYVLSCVGLAETDKHKPLSFVASAGCDEAFVERNRVTWAGLEQSGGAVQAAIQTRRPVVCRDFQDYINLGRGCAEAIKLRGAAVLLLPLVEGDILLGLWFICAAKADAFDSKVVTVLSEVGRDLTYAILALRPQPKQKRETTELVARYTSLTPREREVMGLVSCGLLNKQIAAQLGTAQITVKVQRAKVMKKMQARSVAELVRMADKVGSKLAKRPERRWPTKLRGG